MTVPAYEAMFHALSIFATQILNSEEEHIHCFMKSSNNNLQILTLHMTYLVKVLIGL